MKLRITQNYLHNISKIGLFICVIAIIIQLFPSDNRFRYEFEIGKPWAYELMTANFDFPIYKNEFDIATEKGKILENYIPYFVGNENTYQNQLEKFVAEYSKTHGGKPIHFDIIKRKFESIYKKGIISSNDYRKLIQEKKNEINRITESNVIQPISIHTIYTPKTAYEEIIKDTPDALKSYNLNKYLVENLKFDSTKSELAKKELLKNLSLTTGIVQTGERIIDKGEIVSPETYMILNSLRIESENRTSTLKQSTLVLLGEIIIIGTLAVLFFIYLFLFRPRIYSSFRNLIFISLLMIIIIGLASISVHYHWWSYLIVPYALLPIIIRVFYDSRTALLAHITTIMIISFMIENPYQFVITEIITGMLAVSSLKDMTQRSQLAQTALYIFICYIAIYLGFRFIDEGSLTNFNWLPLVYMGMSSAFLLLAYFLIYLFEKIFGLISALTLVELTNINSDLMMNFAEVAPGTFQHSLQVSNLATEAAKRIGANSLLVRTGALYHDIGKMKHPQYFIENQMGGKNPLNEMDMEIASQIIIQHVHDGVEIAKKNKLPNQIIHFITSHHGLGKTRFFYNSFLNQNPDKKPNEAAYVYPGPLPDSKETAILMMADAVEARSRSLQVYTEESINDAVEKMIDSQIAEGQFKNAPISFRDVETVKTVFKEKIKNIYHTRIVYPETIK